MYTVPVCYDSYIMTGNYRLCMFDSLILQHFSLMMQATLGRSTRAYIRSLKVQELGLRLLSKPSKSMIPR